MKTYDSPAASAWFVEKLTIPSGFTSAASSSDTMLLLIDRQTTAICGFTTTATAHGSQAIALLDLILKASRDYPVPDIIFTDILEPTSMDVFCPETHHLRVLSPHDAFFKERGRIERLIGYIRCYLEAFFRNPDDPMKIDLTTAMESFIFDHYIYINLKGREDNAHASA